MIENQDVEVDGQRWKILQAASIEAAMSAIGFARVTGSIGGESRRNGELTANVHRYCARCGGDKLVEAYGACHQ